MENQGGKVHKVIGIIENFSGVETSVDRKKIAIKSRKLNEYNFFLKILITNWNFWFRRNLKSYSKKYNKCWKRQLFIVYTVYCESVSGKK